MVVKRAIPQVIFIQPLVSVRDASVCVFVFDNVWGDCVGVTMCECEVCLVLTS